MLFLIQVKPLLSKTLRQHILCVWKRAWPRLWQEAPMGKTLFWSCFIDSTRLHTILARNSKFAYELLKYNNKQNIEMLNTLIGLTQKYMPGRVADTLLYLKNEIYKSNPFRYKLSKQEFAEMSGMTKESFIRNMKELEVSGIIKQSRSEIEILNEPELTKISKNG